MKKKLFKENTILLICKKLEKNIYQFDNKKYSIIVKNKENFLNNSLYKFFYIDENLFCIKYKKDKLK